MSLNSKNSSFIFLISWFIYLLQVTFCVGLKSCRIDDVFKNNCGANATCEETKGTEGICKCIHLFHLEGDNCVPNSSINNNDQDLNSSSGSSAAFWILIPCFVLILIGALLFLAKRLKLVEKLYQFRVRRYNTVFVTSFQDDDAPIS